MPSIHQIPRNPSSNLKFKADWHVTSDLITAYNSLSKGEREYKKVQDFFKAHEAEIKNMTHVRSILYELHNKKPRLCFLLQLKLKNFTNESHLGFIDYKEPNLFSSNFLDKGLNQARRWEKVFIDIESLKDKINFTFEEYGGNIVDSILGCPVYLDVLSLSGFSPTLEAHTDEKLESKNTLRKESKIDLFERAVKRAKEMAKKLQKHDDNSCNNY